jgi:hypothetical protein
VVNGRGHDSVSSQVGPVVVDSTNGVRNGPRRGSSGAGLMIKTAVPRLSI